MNSVKGTVKNYSKKTNGILMVTSGIEQWWNPLDSSQITSSDLKGKQVELTVVNQEKRIFSNLTIVKDNVQKVKESSVGQIQIQKLIVRQNCLSHAVSLLNLYYGNLPYDSKLIKRKNMENELFRLSESCERRVWRE